MADRNPNAMRMTKASRQRDTSPRTKVQTPL
jgi:hypothetical protein